MTATFQYHYLAADGGVDAVALRFRTRTDAIFAATAAAPDFPGKASTDMASANSWRPQPGSFLVVPTPPDALPPGVDWREVPSNGRTATTFKALLDGLAAGNAGRILGISSTAVEYEDVYHDWRNRDYREAASLRLKSGGPNDLAVPGVITTSTEAGYDTADVLPEDRIYVPLVRLLAFAFPVAPSAEGDSTSRVATVDLGATPLLLLQNKLRAIDLACYNLAGLRRRAQQIQADSTKDLHKLAMARALVQVVTQRYSADARLHPEAHAGRLALLKSVDDLIAQATPCLLNAPQKKVDPKLSARWSQVVAYLVGLLKDKPTLQLLDQVLPTRGDLPIERHAAPRRALIDCVCETVSHAAFWIAEGSDAEGVELLAAALAAMKAGSPPSASSAKSLLDYVAALPFVKHDHPAAEFASPLAACGVLCSVRAGRALMDGAKGGGEQAAAAELKAELGDAIEETILKQVWKALGVEKRSDLDTYVSLTGALYHVDVSDGPKAEIVDKAKEVKENYELAKELRKVEPEEYDEETMEAVRAMKRGDGATAKVLAKLEAFERPGTVLASTTEVLKRVSATAKLVGSAAAFTPEKGGDVDDGYSAEGAAARLKSGKAVVDRTRASFEGLKAIGAISESSEELTTAFLGPASFVFGAAVEGAEALAALKKGDYVEAAGHSLESAGQLLLLLAPETGGVTLLIGGALIAVGVALDSGKTLKELVSSNSETLFLKYMDEFKKGNAAHFADDQGDLMTPADKIKAQIEGGQAELPPLNAWDLQAYGDSLYRAGFAKSEL